MNVDDALPFIGYRHTTTVGCSKSHGTRDYMR